MIVSRRRSSQAPLKAFQGCPESTQGRVGGCAADPNLYPVKYGGDSARGLPSPGGQADAKRSAVGALNLSRHKASGLEAVEDACQRRAFVPKVTVEFGDGAATRIGQGREHMRVGLTQPRHRAFEVPGDQVGRSLD